MGIVINKSLKKESLDDLNKLIEQIYIDNLVNKFCLLNYQEMYYIEKGIFIEKTYIQLSNIEKFEFEYNFNNEYKVFGNEVLIGFVYIDLTLDIKDSFIIVEDYFKKNYQLINENNFEDCFNQKDLINQIIEEKTLTNFNIELKENKMPFYRQMEFKHKKKEKFKC